MRTHHQHTGWDRVRGVEIGHKNFKLKHVEEAYTTEHWIVRIYRVKKPVNRNKKLPHKPIQRKKSQKLKRKGKKGVFRVPLNQSIAKKTRKASRSTLKL
jgi:dolichyl-diphosphooligosaccharide--protein glycosyltransferase